MPKIHQGATLTPHFRDFLPQWIAGQPWYLGVGVPSLTAIGFYRLEDPAGEVGIETHLVSDGAEIYQVPMTYRGAPLTEPVSPKADPLIATAEHSELGTRWIYDATADPVWAAELIALVNSAGRTELTRAAIGITTARGSRLAGQHISPRSATITLSRVLTAANEPVPGDSAPAPTLAPTPALAPASVPASAPEPELLGVILGSWQPHGPGGISQGGRLAAIMARSGQQP